MTVTGGSARLHLRAALSEPDATLAAGIASLDPAERERLRDALRAADPYAEAPELSVKRCQAPRRGMDRCGKPAGMAVCIEGILGRGACADAPSPGVIT